MVVKKVKGFREYMIEEYKAGEQRAKTRAKEMGTRAKEVGKKPTTPTKAEEQYRLPPGRVGRLPEQKKKVAEKKKAATPKKAPVPTTQKATPKGSQQKKQRAVGMTAGAKRRKEKKEKGN